MSDLAVLEREQSLSGLGVWLARADSERGRQVGRQVGLLFALACGYRRAIEAGDLRMASAIAQMEHGAVEVVADSAPPESERADAPPEYFVEALEGLFEEQARVIEAGNALPVSESDDIAFVALGRWIIDSVMAHEDIDGMTRMMEGWLFSLVKAYDRIETDGGSDLVELAEVIGAFLSAAYNAATDAGIDV